jgi:hypothetical protein
VRDVWTDDGFEGGSNGPELEIAEASGEPLADTPDVGSGSQSDELQPRIGQGRESGPPIRRIDLALNQSFGDHPLNQAGDAAGGEKNAIGQVPHAQRMSWRTGEAEKDVVFAERDAVSLLQIHIEPPNDLVVRVEERLPSAKLGLAQTRRHPHERSGSEFAYASILGDIVCLCKLLPISSRLTIRIRSRGQTHAVPAPTGGLELDNS